jgi:hypothetical protein
LVIVLILLLIFVWYDGATDRLIVQGNDLIIATKVVITKVAQGGTKVIIVIGELIELASR